MRDIFRSIYACVKFLKIKKKGDKFRDKNNNLCDLFTSHEIT